MSEIPAEQTGESAAAGETQRALLTPFLTKTYQLVDDPAVDDMISWNEDGSGFIIWKPAEFSRDLLPKYFKHNNLSSFVRQLNTYGFRKVVPDRFEFANDFFKKGEKGLLHDIQRRKMTIGVTSSATSAAEGPSVVQSMQSSLMPKSGDDQQSTPGGSAQLQVTDSTTTTPVVVEENELGVVMRRQETKSSSPELVEENERLEKENQQMTNELSHLQGLCSNIFSMMSNYEPSGQQDLGNMSVDSKQLDLLQSGMVMEEQGGSSGGGDQGAMNDKEVEEKTSPRLFGVSIGAKRQKRNGEDRSSHRRKQRDDAQTENNNYSNTAQSERKQEPDPSYL